jgi:hypothetical protein
MSSRRRTALIAGLWFAGTLLGLIGGPLAFVGGTAVLLGVLELGNPPGRSTLRPATVLSCGQSRYMGTGA